MHHTQFDDWTNYNDEKEHLFLFRKEPGKGSIVEGIQLGLHSGCLIIFALWLFKECKGTHSAHPLGQRGIFPPKVAFRLHNL